MNLLRTERDTLDAYIPRLDKYLSEIPLLELEQPRSGALRKFRELGGRPCWYPPSSRARGPPCWTRYASSVRWATDRLRWLWPRPCTTSPLPPWSS